MTSRLKSNFVSLPGNIVCVLLLSPFLIFSFRLGSLAWPEFGPLAIVLGWTAFQAGVSTTLSLILAILCSRGLTALSQKKIFFLLEGLILLPAFIPPLLMVLSLTHLVEKFMPFPFGLASLIFAQTLTYTGLCAVPLSRILLKEAKDLSEWAYLQDLSPWFFLKALSGTVLRKDIKSLFVLVFAGSFSSLSLPLLVAGSPLFSLEFFIYEHLKDPENWPKALSLILFQSTLIFLICWKVFSKSAPLRTGQAGQKLYLIPQPLFVAIPLAGLVLSLAGLFFISDGKAFLKLLPLIPLILSSIQNSLILSLGAGGIAFLLLILISLSFQNVKARKFIASYTPPGSAFMGFALLIVPFYGERAILIKWILGLSLLIFPWIYRFRGEQTLDKLSQQVETARFLGASWGLIFQAIIWPQSRSMFFLCAGIVSFWACGDFAYSLIVSNGHLSLSLIVYDFFSSYRLDLAVLLSWLLLFLSFFVFLFWTSLAFVFDRKPFSFILKEGIGFGKKSIL